MAAKITALQKLGCAVVFPHQRSTIVLIPTEKGSATVLRSKGKVGVLEEAVGEENEFAHEDGEGEFFGFTGGEEA